MSQGDSVFRQGSDLEVVMTGDVDIPTFVTSWVNACTSAEGQATKVKAEFLGCECLLGLAVLVTPC